MAGTADGGQTVGQDAPEDLVSVREAAQAVGVAPSTVHGWIKSGRLTVQPGVGVRRVSVAAAQALIAPPDPATPADAVAIYEVLRLTDVSRRTIVAWVKKGRLPSWPGRYGMLVRVADVRTVAQQLGALDSTTGEAMLLPPDSLPIREAALQAGVIRASLYNWGRQGLLSVWSGTESGQRVSQADVVALAQRSDRALPSRPERES